MLQEFTSLWKTHAMFDDWEVTKTEAEVNYDKLDESDIFSRSVSSFWIWYVTIIIKNTKIVCEIS